MLQNENPAVLLIIFNRPETTKLVLDALREVKPAKVYVAADGPRVNRPGEAELVNEVRESTLLQIDWDCSLMTLFQETNLGCRRAVKTAIDWFFEHEEMGIIIEDDIIPHKDFFSFCSYALYKYRYNEKIAMISGTNLISKQSSQYYLYSSFGSIWGWATWRRAWHEYDVDMLDFSLNRFIWILFRRFDFFSALYLLNIFHNHKKLEIDTWDTQWTFSMINNHRLSVIPEVNLIKNVGVIGTHSSAEMRNHNLPYGKFCSHFQSRSQMCQEDILYNRRLGIKIFLPAIFFMTAARISRSLGLYKQAMSMYKIISKRKVG